MFLDEKIDRLKRLFQPEDFKVPFTSGSQILKSIESEFIIRKDVSNSHNNLRWKYSNWFDNIKKKLLVKAIDLNRHSEWIDKLDVNTNYWMVIAYQSAPSMKHFVYDCKPNALLALHSISQDDFMIVDKKYCWFAYFRVDGQTQQAAIYRSGEKLTPFEP
ncbi:hypothetical protein C3K47_17130 [Solitalea longa]|uniref:DUF4275 family protein n=1 Tax=Solitalea longa TaxID=2079460 RepID=A0A2S4ZZ36_9SPHI|nr:hypothetical protein [Solitalea longa]POY35123.1 hypothetical protein C3K47_17130 [Solitalea longa]